VHTAEVVGGQLEHWQAASEQVLLVADVLVRGDEQVELAFGQ